MTPRSDPLKTIKSMNEIERITNHVKVSEKAIEAYLVGRIRAIGGVCLKYSNQGETGYPDRIAVFPGGQTVWVELKSTGKKPTKVQTIRIGQLRALGQTVYVADNREIIDEIIERHGI